MKRPLAAAGTSLLIFLLLFFLLDAFRAFGIFAACVGAAIFFIIKRNNSAAEFFTCFACTSAAALLLSQYVIVCLFVPSDTLYGKTLFIEGTADAFCEPYTAAYSFVSLKNCSINGTATNTDISVMFPSSFGCEYGDSVRTTVYVFSERADSLAANGFSVTPRAKALGTPKVPSRARHSFVYYAKLSRQKLAARLDRNLPEEQASVVKALLLGDRSSLSSPFRTNLRISGASHLFAVSGMHLSLWSGVVFLLLRKRSRTKLLPNTAAGLFVLFYMALTGFSPSVNRSGIMLLTVFTGYCFRRPADPLNSLGASALILLLIDPLTAADPSFLLSYAATAAVFILYPHFERRAQRSKNKGIFLFNKVRFSVRNTILLSLCVMLFTVPISGEFFGCISLLSPVASLLCTFPVEGVMISSALALALSPLHSISSLLFSGCSELTAFIIRQINSLATHDFAVFPADMKLIVIWYLLTGAVVLAVYRFGKKNVTKTLTSLLVCTILLLPCLFIANLSDQHTVYLYLNNEGKSCTGVLYSGTAGDTCLFYNSDDENSIPGILSLMSQKVLQEVDTLIVPTVKAATNNALTALQSDIPVKNIVGASGNGNFRCDLTNEIIYNNLSDECPGAGVLCCGGIKTVFRFCAGSVCNDNTQELSRGDLLICRAQLPEDVIPENYGMILVISDESAHELQLPANAVSTADTGGITIKYNVKEGKYALDR